MNHKPRDGPFNSGPEILRPIPRRPFNLNSFTTPTPPEEDDSPQDRDRSSPRPTITASDLRFLDPHNQIRDRDTPLSHTTSYLNLTSPTLFGIYTPSTTDPFNRDDNTSPAQDRTPNFPPSSSSSASTALNNDNDSSSTLNDSNRRPRGVDDETYELMRTRSAGSSSSYARRNSTFTDTSEIIPPLGTAGRTRKRKREEVVLAMGLRAGLLFVLGVGYGVLVMTRFPQQDQGQGRQEQGGSLWAVGREYAYLGFWGVAGVVLGGLLPWFDRVWEEAVGARKRRMGMAGPGESASASAQAETAAPDADWALVIRGVGAFVGIVFAIRKLPWTSTMQVSLTLALANPFLWYLIDRSKPGFLLSAAVGLAGSAVLMGVNPDMMPVPAGLASSSAGSLFANADGAQHDPSALGGLASQETVETSIWMLSVLFCSCLCFGNIGRRLALNSSAVGRGRWGGVR